MGDLDLEVLDDGRDGSAEGESQQKDPNVTTKAVSLSFRKAMGHIALLKGGHHS